MIIQKAPICKRKNLFKLQKSLDKLLNRGYSISILESYESEVINLIKTNKLRGLIVEKGLSQSDVAKNIGIAPKTFYEKMKKGVFGTDEVEKMIQLLDIKDPADIFFADGVTSKDTKRVN